MFLKKFIIMTSYLFTALPYSLSASNNTDILPLEAPLSSNMKKTAKTASINVEQFNKFVESQKDEELTNQYPIYKQKVSPNRHSQSFGNSIGIKINDETGEEEIGGLDFLRQLNNWQAEQDKKIKESKKKEVTPKIKKEHQKSRCDIL